MIDRLDHFVLTVQDIEATCRFYEQVLKMKAVTFGNGRWALEYGQQKINLHQAGHEFEPKAQHPVPGSADLCFLTSVPLEQVVQHVESCGVAIIEGPVQRTGATGPILSVYLRDPDGNLIELSQVHNLSDDAHVDPTVARIRSLFRDREPGIMGDDRYGLFSVLLPLVHMEDGRLGILFEKRASTMRRQANEVCFPGGRTEESDESRWATARRETSEELGLPLDRIQYIGDLDILLGPGRGSIFPFVGYLEDISDMQPNPDEVGEVFIISLDTLLAMEPAIHTTSSFMQPEEDFPFHLIPGGKRYPWRTGTVEHLFYEVEGRVIWGMTARVLAHFLELIRQKGIAE
ncbi:VOC family protein [Brevibacillus choshinensis]|uniref:VOC family protein n=1 Tax=Brevibacillus choshinensis TaxID=54911 RepID=UPI002E22DA55|nr:NUDIX domain-containing protein [Brevibacillus choshinensis]MED4752829.1 NUDIX domain-containing protein [Brevibacillus choshinensis]MED4781594.1 NUDIX domain-containing protein [Brevibacillus choshinensis]